MLVAKVSDGQVLEVADYRAMFPDTSFSTSGPSPEFYAENGLMPVTVFKPHDRTTEKLVAVDPYIEGGEVFTVAVEPLTPEELAQRTDTQWAAIRSQRNALLSACDWTQLPDAPVDAAAWAAYRQALRDITEQTDPFAIVWPAEPA